MIESVRMATIRFVDKSLTVRCLREGFGFVTYVNIESATGSRSIGLNIKQSNFFENSKNLQGVLEGTTEGSRRLCRGITSAGCGGKRRSLVRAALTQSLFKTVLKRLQLCVYISDLPIPQDGQNVLLAI